jgi:hypothetical protein
MGPGFFDLTGLISSFHAKISLLSVERVKSRNCVGKIPMFRLLKIKSSGAGVFGDNTAIFITLLDNHIIAFKSINLMGV